MSLFGLNSYRSALEIRDFSKANKIGKNQTEIRGAARIVSIDDEKLKAAVNLKAYGYNIDEIQDISRISEIEKYDIILCDLMGVGGNFDKSIGGASIIKEVKLNYPSKFVVAYTGARINAPEAARAREYCDHFMKKDADMSEWTAVLDGFVDRIMDPYEMWLIVRDDLLDHEMDIRDVVRLESAYVKSVLKKDDQFSELTSLIGKLNLSSHAKAILQGLVSSAIYGLLFA